MVCPLSSSSHITSWCTICRCSKEPWCSPFQGFHEGCPLPCFSLPASQFASSLKSMLSHLFWRKPFLAWLGPPLLYSPTLWGLLHSALNHSCVKWSNEDVVVWCTLPPYNKLWEWEVSPSVLSMASVWPLRRAPRIICWKYTSKYNRKTDGGGGSMAEMRMKPLVEAGM